MVPDFPWERVAFPVAKWMGVSSEQLATTFPYFNTFERTDLVPAEEFQMKRCADSANLDWYEGAALMSLDSFALVGGALRGGRIFNRYPASVVSGNSRDLGRGGWSQSYFWERVAVPVAKWMGVS